MRLVEFDSSGVVSLISRYGHEKLRLVVESSLLLPFNAEKESYVFVNDAQRIPFSVCAGEGALFFKDYPRPLNFARLEVQELDYYLVLKHFGPRADSTQRELIKQFIEVYDMNLGKQGYYLNPPYFEQVERQIFRC